MSSPITQYINEINRIFRVGNATEHSYRPALQRLLEELLTRRCEERSNLYQENLRITNEPKRIACGAPDYIVTRRDVPLGYIEAKDIATDLDARRLQEQFNRYRQSLDNLIITDYLRFRLYEAGTLTVDVTIARKRLTAGENARRQSWELTNSPQESIEALPEAFAEFETLMNRFVGYQGVRLRTSAQLSRMMAMKARFLAYVINTSLTDDLGEEGAADAADKRMMATTVSEQFLGFREFLMPDVSVREFSDVYAQTIAYGMFAARLNAANAASPMPPFTREEAARNIPVSNPFLRKLFQYIAGYDLDERIRWVVDDMAEMFNIMQGVSINIFVKIRNV